MKKFAMWGMLLTVFFLGSSVSLHGQDVSEINTKKTTIKVKKKTIMELYEPEMILSVDARIQLKKERIATIKKRRGIIDTLDISDRRRRRLLEELYRTPFSNKWDRVIADIKFEDDEY